MLSSIIISAAISSASPYVSTIGHEPYEPSKQESIIPSCATLPRRKERLTRYERRHPQLSSKEKAAFRRLLAGGKR